MPLILRERASRHALYGVAIAIAAVILATLLVSVHVYDGITIDNVVRAHRENMALWILNALPFIYAAWGQYASMSMARMARSMIQQRTKALKREMEKIEESARLRTDFLARVSHELRTPLNAIIGMAQLLDEGDLDRRRRRRVEVIRESAEGLLTMINDLLDFSRMESGQVELDEVEFNLRESLDGAVKLVAPEAERKGLDLRVELAEDMPTWVSGDPGRLRQIVINLLGNAIKFTEAGHVALRLGRWERAGEARVRLIFEVVDTGPGIDPTDVERLFEPYTRGREEGGGGTGLGLSITRQLVEAMGGTIDVDSEPGEGSVFRFSVELAEAEALDLATLSRQVDLQGVRVLLAEAPSQSRVTLVGQLRALGLQVATADDGHDAMQRALRAAAKHQPYDLVLVDMFLPGFSGEELGRRLRERSETAHLVLAIMTTAGARGDARRLQEIGFSGYLARPIPPEDLRDVVTALLAVQSLPPAQRQAHGMVTRHSLRDQRRGMNKVLLVEDSELNQEITLSLLEPLGCTVDLVQTGAEGVERAAAEEYAVALVDFQLPDINGSRVVEQVRGLEGRHGRIPLLVFTAGATEAEKRQCRQAGADGFLLKPITASELRRALGRYVALGGPVASAGGEEEVTIDTPGRSADPALIRTFLGEAGGRMAELRRAVEREFDAELFVRHAHSLKGASRYVTDGPLPEAAADLEERARRGDVAGVRDEAFPALEAAWRRLREELQASAPARDQAAEQPADARAAQ